MDIKASLNNQRVAPRKARLVADLIRNKNLVNAKSLLQFATKKSADPILKLLNSALASAVTNFKLKESDLYISKITVDEGPKFKRFFPMSRGRGYPIMKRTSHITLVLSEKSKPADKKEKKSEKTKDSAVETEKKPVKKVRSKK